MLAVTGFPRATKTVCPVCLQTVPALLVGRPEAVELEGSCPDHGTWRTAVWSGLPSFDSWCAGASSAPIDHTCTALIEVTQRCDLGCPVCFAEAGPDVARADPSLAQLEQMLGGLFATQGAVNLQLSGGEPTAREDLPEVIAAACKAGFTFVQLNTNGLRLAGERDYAERLRSAGLASVFLQFDGVHDETYRVLRGRPLLGVKIRAIERCAAAGLAVVLVPTLVAGVNDQEVGALVRMAASWPGIVRGLHFQPVSYFGRYLHGERRRLTLPQVLRSLEDQTEGEVRAGDFAPSCCEHVRCSFRGRYWVREGGRLELLRAPRSCCSPSPEEPAGRAIAVTARQWARAQRGKARGPSCCETGPPEPPRVRRGGGAA